jgi:hypothetical protein
MIFQMVHGTYVNSMLLQKSRTRKIIIYIIYILLMFYGWLYLKFKIKHYLPQRVTTKKMSTDLNSTRQIHLHENFQCSDIFASILECSLIAHNFIYQAPPFHKRNLNIH